jgi:hypothetical protein
LTDINKLQDTKQTTSQTVGVTGEMAHRGTEAVQQGGRAAGETVRQGASLTADLTERSTEAAGEAIRRVGEATNETLLRSTQDVTESHRQIAQDAAQRFEQMSHKVSDVMQGTSENMRHLFALPNAAQGGLRDMQKSVADLVEGVVQTNLRATQELFRLGNPVAVMELQQRFLGEYVDMLMQGTTALVRAIRRTADETLRPLEAQVARGKLEQRMAHVAE